MRAKTTARLTEPRCVGWGEARPPTTRQSRRPRCRGSTLIPTYGVAGHPLRLSILLLPLLTGCGNDTPTSEPPPPRQTALTTAVQQTQQANVDALEALKQARQLEQSLQDSADRRRREMEKQGM